MKVDEKKLKKALYKRALGCVVKEENKEFSMVDGALVLTRKKVSVKEVPPEIKAIEMLAEADEDSLSDLSAEELEREKLRLLKMLKNVED